jgi:hypothetical protein
MIRSATSHLASATTYVHDTLIELDKIGHHNTPEASALREALEDIRAADSKLSVTLDRVLNDVD